MPNSDYSDFFKNYSPNRDQTPSPEPDPETPKPRKPKRHLKPWFKITLTVIAFGLIAAILAVSVSHCNKETPNDTASGIESVASNTGEHIPINSKPKFAEVKETTVTLSGQIDSKYAVIIDVSNNTILARKSADETIYPASLTKIMTLLVAAENVKDLNATFTMTSAIIDPLYRENAAMAGFMPGEACNIKDMFYGSMLESGAEATVGLAVHIAGSEERFVELMNQKAADLGLTKTHFTNTTGLHNKQHYTTCNEFAVILTAAMKNDFVKTLLTTERYTVPKNSYHSELNFHSTCMSRMYGTEPEVATILGGKTGFTSNSGNCLATVGITDDGRDIVCITAAAEGTYKPIYDAILLYKEYTHPAK